MIRLIFKTLIAMAATEYAGGGLLLQSGIFGVVYAVATYYAWYLDIRGGFFNFIRESGFSNALFSIAYLTFSPLIPFTVLALIINTVEIGETAGAFISILITAAGFCCFIQDCMCAYSPGKKW